MMPTSIPYSLLIRCVCPASRINTNQVFYLTFCSFKIMIPPMRSNSKLFIFGILFLSLLIPKSFASVPVQGSTGNYSCPGEICSWEKPGAPECTPAGSRCPSLPQQQPHLIRQDPTTTPSTTNAQGLEALVNCVNVPPSPECPQQPTSAAPEIPATLNSNSLWTCPLGYRCDLRNGANGKTGVCVNRSGLSTCPAGPMLGTSVPTTNTAGSKGATALPSAKKS